MSAGARLVMTGVVFLAALSPGVASAVDAPVPAAAERLPAVVSLTFDDGWKSQGEAATVLSEHGMVGTFFVNSGMWTYPGYLSRSELAAMARRGHEIAGHTLTHPHLGDVSRARQVREVCQDRANLLALGTPVTSFAYPYGEVDARLKEVVRSCGYSSARLVNGLADQPPANPLCDCVGRLPFSADRWAVPVKPTVRSADSLAKLKRWVLQAERVGGWVPVVFHRVCDGCAEESTSLAEFTAFVEWLSRRPATTRVETFGDVVGPKARGAAGDDTLRVLPAAQPVERPTAAPGGEGQREYAFSVAGQGVGQAQVVFAFISVALVVGLGYRFTSRGRRMA